jgi:peptide/nickel transport system permease protein
MRPTRRLALRLLAGLGVLWGTVTLIFAAINLTPGDPAVTILGGPDALPTAAALARVRMEYGLDQPLYAQYGHFLARLLRGDLGLSYRLHLPVSQLIGEQAGATAVLTLSAMALGASAALAIALASAGRARWLTGLLGLLEMTASSTPAFVVGLLLLVAFSFSLHLLPSSGTHGWTSDVLPAITLALPITGALAQVLRRAMEDVLDQPFILTARARGLSEAGVRLGHALRHALIPLLTISGSIFAALLSSAVVGETVFNRQGLGRLMADATVSRDVPLVLGVILIATTANIGVNMIVDFLYILADPRVDGR